ncbi:hypothetical protein [Fusobacterium varium]|uniref:hypothetical protein n=1 Tax=Fusobacterium varium TaxID=856 RepID=UPI000E4079E1|nr:hypothetical protein [Fusobacterium varium]RGJ30428.1 hypothetical protein DXD66_05065 [Fusobacterium varium]
MNTFNENIAMMTAVMEEIKENYNLEGAEGVSSQITNKKVVMKLNDNGIKVSIEYDREAALGALYRREVKNRGVSGVSKEDFIRKYDEGVPVEEIVKTVATEKLPGMIEYTEKNSEIVEEAEIIEVSKKDNEIDKNGDKYKKNDEEVPKNDKKVKRNKKK